MSTQTSFNFSKRKGKKKREHKMKVGETRRVRIPASTRTLKKVTPTKAVFVSKGGRRRRRKKK